MLIELDQSTLANMTAALEAVCKKLPPDKDSHESRKQIADAMAKGKGDPQKLLNGGDTWTVN